jgi:hypothetical protein
MNSRESRKETTSKAKKQNKKSFSGTCTLLPFREDSQLSKKQSESETLELF